MEPMWVTLWVFKSSQVGLPSDAVCAQVQQLSCLPIPQCESVIEEAVGLQTTREQSEARSIYLGTKFAMLAWLNITNTAR